MADRPKVDGEYTRREVWPRRGDEGYLPPGQRISEAMPRFGMRPGLLAPPIPDHPILTIAGDVAEKTILDLELLSTVDRVDVTADFHCVTTWSVRDLRWGGWRLRDVWEQLIVPNAQPVGGATHLRAISSDRYSAALPIEDALADDVLIADRLEGRPLTPFHGAPLRLVTPAHFAYKSVKHLAALTVHTSAPKASGGSMQHPRGRVEHEERHGRIPGRLLRWPYRLLVVPTAMRAQRASGNASRSLGATS
ncbi:MAG: molybdopterin-dependent oxidoreductase [Acidimicrobiia bacterium]|nr:molybdopterin-dependent oxidoreductase [Acidimicrobiia bacterium]MBT8191802.1 molybdopterin-dependent oxidoreductase [Acidimicrobiia bacterium]NNF89285.1 molybdopterin-dependent oxidoreductase [Acidimicrobiia bacterium]NNJ47191.1 molybdopterin-dependent oxidoreductase [Acidimicrobiia bacterium]NNL13504.1 molybdopterin-dependent oxidoreductase [Acidimicrobiia bacterium]